MSLESLEPAVFASCIVPHLPFRDALSLRLVSHRVARMASSSPALLFLQRLLAMSAESRLTELYALLNLCGAEILQREAPAGVQVLRGLKWRVGSAALSLVRVRTPLAEVESYEVGVSDEHFARVSAQLPDLSTVDLVSNRGEYDSRMQCTTHLPTYVDAALLGLLLPGYTIESLMDEGEEDIIQAEPKPRKERVSFDSIPMRDDVDGSEFSSFSTQNLECLQQDVIPAFLSRARAVVVRQDLLLARYLPEFVDQWLEEATIFSMVGSVIPIYGEHFQLWGEVRVQGIVIIVSLIASEIRDFYGEPMECQIHVEGEEWGNATEYEPSIALETYALEEFPFDVDLFDGMSPREIFGLLVISVQAAAVRLYGNQRGISYNAFELPALEWHSPLGIGSLLNRGPESPFGDAFELSDEEEDEDDEEELELSSDDGELAQMDLEEAPKFPDVVPFNAVYFDAIGRSF